MISGFRIFTMSRAAMTCCAFVGAVVLLTSARGEDAKPYTGAACAAPVEPYFINEVWAKVGSQECLKCHKAGGDAEDSEFILRDPSAVQGDVRNAAMRHNRDAFMRMAQRKSGDQPRILMKVTARVKHGGKEVLKPDSAGYRILEEFARRINAPTSEPASPASADKDARPFFDGVAMVDDRVLLRRATLSLAGRLPTHDELAAVTSHGLDAMPAILDAVMKEDAFFDRLREGFNDIFLTVGYDDVPETALSYEHFSETRGWPQKYDLTSAGDEDAQRKARYKLYDDYRAAMLGEPMKLIEYIVRNDRPFTEIVTADYIMVTPYTSRGYGIYDELKPRFKNPDDPLEYIPVRLKALVGRNKSDNQESATGYYPHAGILSTFQYLRRYPTTETNRNRLRARMYYQFFLGIDVLELAARVSDAAAVTAKFEIPTMQASECVVCHKTLDPLAGLYQDYWSFNGVYGRRKDGWFKDMFAAGFEGEDLPADERWRSLQWLGERTAKDPRFAVAMVEHAWYLVSGRKVLQPPKDIDDPLYAARRRAYQAQRDQVEAIAAHFAADEFNFKNVLKAWVLSDFYRADGLKTAAESPARRVELDDVGIVRLLSPEQLERKVKAIFGMRWGQLREQTAMLYGGIDSKEVTERATDPSGAMGAIQRILANDVACRHVLQDFTRKSADRLLFPDIEPDVLPGASPEADAKIRTTIVHLHELILGRYDAPDSPQVVRTVKLFAGIVADAAGRKGIESREIYHARRYVESPVDDPHYTIRAWRAVVTYLLRQHDFLYE